MECKEWKQSSYGTGQKDCFVLSAGPAISGNSPERKRRVLHTRRRWKTYTRYSIASHAIVYGEVVLPRGECQPGGGLCRQGLGRPRRRSAATVQCGGEGSCCIQKIELNKFLKQTHLPLKPEAK
ncbi:hypothetical protein HJG60_009390 [Phyllostomus discolor]|uniref:Uncharacterized protein n=1 Tax=Phyllostomus discolor TaxID=89673 RepID=A0A834DCQ3_9CHIR|nr:hypothetical protein HJG60_009390 [Phyllostomus discolor]